MNNDIYLKLLEVINAEREAFETLVNADNALGLNLTSNDIINYLEFSSINKPVSYQVVGSVIITEGDILSILTILRGLVFYEGKYLLYINDDNRAINTYLVNKINKIYKELCINTEVEIVYSKNYNKHLNELVTAIGSEEFINAVSKDFNNINKIIM